MSDNFEDKMLAHKHAVDKARRDRAIMRDKARAARAAAAMRAMADPSLRPIVKRATT